MTPVLVQEVAYIEDIEGQLDGIDLTSHLEAELLTEVNIEMMLESQIVSITLVVFSTMLAEIRIVSNPLLQHLALHFLGKLVAMIVAKHTVGEGILVVLGLLETHLVNLCIGWDVEEVITLRSVFVYVSIIIIGIRRTALTLVDDTESGLPLLLMTVLDVVVSRSLDAMRHIVGRVAHLKIVAVTIGIMAGRATLCDRRTNVGSTASTGQGIA